MKTLIEINDTGITTWQEWMRAWDSTDVFEFRHSLVHFGFNVQVHGPEEWKERLLFYINAADGWDAYGRQFVRPDEVPEFNAPKPIDPFLSGRKNPLLPWECRVKIARKAFEVVCTNIFRDPQDREHGISIFTAMRDVDVLDRVIEFFLSSRVPPFEKPARRYANVPLGYLSKDQRHEHTMREFYTALARAGFVQPEHRPLPDWLEKRLPEYRVKFIEIMTILTDLQFLTGPGNLFRLLDDACMQKLEELVLRRGKADEIKTNVVETLIRDGNRAAQALVLLRAMRAEDARLQEIADAERLIQKLQRN